MFFIRIIKCAKSSGALQHILDKLRSLVSGFKNIIEIGAFIRKLPAIIIEEGLADGYLVHTFNVQYPSYKIENQMALIIQYGVPKKRILRNASNPLKKFYDRG